MEVIKGALPILPFVKVVQLELAFVPLYQDTPLLKEVLSTMESFDFSLFNLTSEFADPSGGQALQANGIFVNNRHRKN